MFELHHCSFFSCLILVIVVGSMVTATKQNQELNCIVKKGGSEGRFKSMADLAVNHSILK
jgi:hypothetical protein